MCGIAGILSLTNDPSRTRAAVERMQRALIHRGPDDSGLWQSAEGNVGFAHCRLSILDLSNAARQPMRSPDGRFTITFNGEIYNFHELRADLQKSGALFYTASDTEVILRLFEREGIGCARHLRGMFAFAIWDARERTCSLARDPLGIKPLYIHESGDTFAFASELRALIQSRLFPPTLRALAVQRYFETGSVPEPLTLVNEAECLEAGQSLVWRDGRTTKQTFWQVSFVESQTYTGDPVRATREALLDSVNQHFVSDVPVGLFLSGGVDSTAILALAHATGHRGVEVFSIAVDDEAADESPVARRTAAHFGARYHELRLDASVAQGLFDDFLGHLDQPTIDGFNTFIVSALARKNGMKVVLSGLGGDEIFGGYSSFAKIPQMLRWHKMLRHIPGVTAAAGVMLRRKPQGRRMIEFLRSPGTVEDAFTSLRGIFSRAEAKMLAEWITGRSDLTESPTSNLKTQTSTIGDEVSRLELTRYMRNQLLRDSDVMSMAHGLELRVPFVDRVLFEAVAGIPAAIRLQHGKRLLANAAPEIPEWVMRQKKRGFLFPFQKWLGSEWGVAFGRATIGAPVPTPNWYQRWSLFALRKAIDSLGCSSNPPSPP